MVSQFEADNSIADLPFHRVLGESVLAIIAGSDTTSTVLSSAVYLLLNHPDVYKRLQAEIADNFLPEEDPIDPARLAKMSWLNACMYVLASDL